MSVNRFAVMASVCAAFAFAGGAAAQIAGNYFDIPPGYWAEDAIDYVTSAGIMSGPGDKPGYFDPAGTVNRAQLAVVLKRAHDANVALYVDLVAPMLWQDLKAQNLPVQDLETFKKTIRDQVQQKGYYDPTDMDVTTADSRNTQRKMDLNIIMNAMYQYAIDNDGALPSGITSNGLSHICKTGVACPQDMVDLSELNERHLASLPIDPSNDDGLSTGYVVMKLQNGRIYLEAPLAENGVTISNTR